MGNCLAKGGIDDDDGTSSTTTYESATSDVEVTDHAARRQGSRVGEAMGRAADEATRHAAKARVLQARDALLAVADAHTWLCHGDDAVRRVLDDAAFVDRAMDDVGKEEGYLLSRERPIRILYRQRQGVHSIKIKACLAHHPARVTSIAFEWDLLPQWNRFCVEALKFRSDSPHQALVYGCSWMFYPFRDFQAFMLASGFDLSELHGALLIAIRDADGPGNADASASPAGPAGPGSVSLPKATKKRRWVEFLDCSYVMLTPVFCDEDGDDTGVHTSAELSVHLRPHVPYIPTSLINWVLHTFAPYLFHSVDRALDSLFHVGSSVYLERMQQSPAVYGLITDAVESLGKGRRTRSVPRTDGRSSEESVF